MVLQLPLCPTFPGPLASPRGPFWWSGRLSQRPDVEPPSLITRLFSARAPRRSFFFSRATQKRNREVAGAFVATQHANRADAALRLGENNSAFGHVATACTHFRAPPG